VICGRNTNEKKYFVDEWGNQFFSCKNCRQVWCTNCLGQLTGIGSKKTFKLGKRGRVNCTVCNQFLPMIKLPINLPFVQENIQKGKKQVESGELKFCTLCRHEINKDAKYCENCGGEQ
jgi:hypothetical protein